MNININQGNVQENITSAIIVKLYEVATAVGNTVQLSGNLYSPTGYAYQIDYLNQTFGPNFTLTVPETGKYIHFADSEVERVLKANNVSSDGIGISGIDASTASLGSVFKNNTTITSFDEFRYFTTWNASSYSFEGCTNLETISVSPTATAIPNKAFYQCSSLQTVFNLSNITTVGQHAFAESSITNLTLPNVDYINEYAVSKAESLDKIILNENKAIQLTKHALKECRARAIVGLNLNSLVCSGNEYGTNWMDMPNLEGRWEFAGCTSCETYNSTNTSWYGDAFYNMGIEELSLPNIIEYGLDNNNGDPCKFSKMPNVKKITLGKIKYVYGGRDWGDDYRRLFNGCPKLRVVDFGSEIIEYSTYGAFRGCNVLAAIIFRVSIPPTNTRTSFNDFCAGYKPYIFVPDTAVNTWKQDSGWSFAADYIRPLSEYVESDYITWSTDVVFGRTHNVTFDLNNPPTT